MQLQTFLRKSHKILSIFVFIQLLLWMISGLYMTSVPLDKVHGDHLIEHHGLPPIQRQSLMPLDKVLAVYPTTHTVQYFTRVDGVPVLQLTGAYTEDSHEQRQGNSSVFLNASSGEPLSALNEAQVRKLVTQVYAGQGQLNQLESIPNASDIAEIRGRQGPVWRATFDSLLNDTIYISADTGRIVAARSDLWRWFDFLWMLHIMDYQTRDNFNNPLVILMASLGLLVTLSGSLMLARGLKKYGWKFLR